MTTDPPIIVFAGPSLRAEGPGDAAVTLRPPARSGDLLQACADKPAAILLLDTVPLRGPQPSYEEIASVLRGGVALFGAAGQGAFWAADLADQGMTGIGQIYRDIASGRVNDYHEVAIPDTQHTSQVLALYNIRQTLARAVDDGALTQAQSDALCAGVAALPLTERTADAVAARAADQVGQDTARTLIHKYFDDPIDQCRLDAREALASVAALVKTGKPPIAGPARKHTSKTAKELEILHRAVRIDGVYLSHKSLVGGFRLLCDAAPGFHRRIVLQMLRQDAAVLRHCDPDSSDAQVFAAFAMSYGLGDGAGLLAPYSSTAPAVIQDAQDLETAILGWVTARARTGLDALAIDALITRPEFSWLADRLITLHRFNSGFDSRGGFLPEWLHVDQLRRFYSARWGIEPDQFDPAFRLRGFRNLEEFRQIAARHFLFDQMLLAKNTGHPLRQS